MHILNFYYFAFILFFLVGCSLSANTIPVGSSGILTNLIYINPTSKICIIHVVLFNSDAIALNTDFIGGCIEY